MPSLDPGDRKLLLIAGSILVVLLAATVALSPSSEDIEGQGTPTTYSTAPNGAQAAYFLLGQLGYRSERWQKSPAELSVGASGAKGTILILAGPSDIPNKSERDSLIRFVRAGGWLIYAGNFPFLFLESGSVSPPSILRSGLVAENFPAAAPSPFTRSAPEITMFASTRWLASDGTQVPLYGDAIEPVVVTWKLEKGRILWWAAPTPLTNSGISRAGNLDFFLDCIRAVRPGASRGETTVLWDEYFHGYRGSLWSYFEETPVPWAIYQLAFLAVLIFWAFGRRSGPLYAPVTAQRLSPLEFVDTLGDLYRRAHAGSAAVRVAYHRFRTQLTRRLALAPSAPNRQLDTAARERLGWKQPGLFDTLQRAERAAGAGDLSGSEALNLVQALEHYEVLFELKARPGSRSDEPRSKPARSNKEKR
jgi:hypothetical protein